MPRPDAAPSLRQASTKARSPSGGTNPSTAPPSIWKPVAVVVMRYDVAAGATAPSRTRASPSPAPRTASSGVWSRAARSTRDFTVASSVR